MNLLYRSIIKQIKANNKKYIKFEDSDPFVNNYSDIDLLIQMIKIEKHLHFFVPEEGRNILFGAFYSVEDGQEFYLIIRCDGENKKFRSYLSDEKEFIEFIWLIKESIRQNFCLIGL